MAALAQSERIKTPRQVADIFGKSQRAIIRLCRLGKIEHCEMVGGRYYIDAYAEWPSLFTAEIEAEEHAKLKA